MGLEHYYPERLEIHTKTQLQQAIGFWAIPNLNSWLHLLSDPCNDKLMLHFGFILGSF